MLEDQEPVYKNGNGSVSRKIYLASAALAGSLFVYEVGLMFQNRWNETVFWDIVAKPVVVASYVFKKKGELELAIEEIWRGNHG